MPMPNILPDTGIWYALCDPRDPCHSAVRDRAGLLDLHHVVLPWPVVYETLCTRFVRNAPALSRLSSYLKRPRITYLDDSPYVRGAFELVFESSLSRSRPLSMVDCAIRLVLADVNVKIDYLMTFNSRDFVDVCARRRIMLV